ncbi:hypothetical protein WCE37_09440 [Luteimonas sp. MJ250]|uniref:hypothetical protein n=1 Tax=Luteimonas sp. MJ250 TaxID=3129236 RepID=UPI0031BB48EE
MENNWVWLVAGAVIGWVGTQFGTLVKDVLRRYLLKRAIVSELRQLHEESRRVWTSLARTLQIHSLGGVDPSLPLPLSNRAYAGHYDDALLVFTRVQRTAMALVHKYVDEVNLGIEDLRASIKQLNDSHHRQEYDGPGFERFGLRLQAVMGNAAEVLWLTNYYMTRPEFPVLEADSPELEAYQKYVDSYRDECKSIIASVTGLTREDFEHAYRPARPPGPGSG